MTLSLLVDTGSPVTLISGDTVGSLYYASVLFMRLCDFSLQTHY